MILYIYIIKTTRISFWIHHLDLEKISDPQPATLASAEDTNDYVARVEPSDPGGHKLAVALKDAILDASNGRFGAEGGSRCAEFSRIFQGNDVEVE